VRRALGFTATRNDERASTEVQEAASRPVQQEERSDPRDDSKTPENPGRMATPLRICRNYLLRRCPSCGHGAIYRTLFEMRRRCPTCDVQFEREPGYFVGSMYVSYFFSAVLLGLFATLVWLIWPQRLDLGYYVLIALVPFLPLTPFVQQYSRILWMYVDLSIWPQDASEMTKDEGRMTKE
jgi:uncharacterized protein (DUF983 family)